MSAEKAFYVRFGQKLDEYTAANPTFKVLAFNDETEDFTFEGPVPPLPKIRLRNGILYVPFFDGSEWYAKLFYEDDVIEDAPVRR